MVRLQAPFFRQQLSPPPARASYTAIPSFRLKKAGIWQNVAILPQHTQRDADQLNRRWRPALMSFFLRRVRNHAEAEDLTQEVFARLLMSADRPTSSPDAYIFQVAVNLLRDGARRNKVRADYLQAAVVLDDQDVELLDPSHVVGARDALAAFIGGLEALPERTRSIFILYRIENLELETIASSFGISKSAVKKQVMKAMAMLMARVRDFR